MTINTDENPLDSIVGKAEIMSEKAFLKRYPQGKVPRQSPKYGSVFVCRRGCNTKTARFTEEFVWEEVYKGFEDLDELKDRIERDTAFTRKRKESTKPDAAPGSGSLEREEVTDIEVFTPRKRKKTNSEATPDAKRLKTTKKPTTPSSKRYNVDSAHT